MSKILIASLWNFEPVLKSATTFGAERIYLIIDNKDKDIQNESLNILKSSIGKITDLETVKIDQYDIQDVAKKTLDIIDSKTNHNDTIYIDVTAGRKPVAFGMIYAAYVRLDRIESIVYVTEEDKELIYLPKLSFNLSKSQRLILDYINSNKIESYSKFADDIGFSRAMLYNNIRELVKINLIKEDKDGLKLTDSGKISLM